MLKCIATVGIFIMSKITFTEWRDLFLDPDVSDDDILKVSKIERGEGGFGFRIVPNPEFVDVDDAPEGFVIDLGNWLARIRRHAKFKRRRLFGAKGPVLVSEMDSWGQFPLLIDEIVDHLDEMGFLVWSFGAAGDTLDNMVHGSNVPGKTEYMDALRDQKDEVQAFIFSAAGNDVIGEEPDTKVAALENLINEFDPRRPDDVAAHINSEALSEVLEKIKAGYRKMIGDVRAEFPNLPILVHGYDYCFPYPWEGDNRNPIYAERDGWLGQPLDKRKIPHGARGLRRGIIKHLIDRLYELLEQIAGEAQHIHVVNCRGSMPDLADWKDEIHGTSEGFKKVAARFADTLEELTVVPLEG